MKTEKVKEGWGAKDKDKQVAGGQMKTDKVREGWRATKQEDKPL
jgi:hypothetical protein